MEKNEELLERLVNEIAAQIELNFIIKPQDWHSKEAYSILLHVSSINKGYEPEYVKVFLPQKGHLNLCNLVPIFSFSFSVSMS